MKNKSKLAKIKNQNKVNVNAPDGWFLMCADEVTISVIDTVLGKGYDVEIWTDAGVAEVTIGEKASIDIESMECDLQDDYSNEFLSKNGVKSLFYITFKKDNYEQAKPVLEKLSSGINGFVCGDTEDFSPRL